ncbi:hypothetical protein JL193_16290 [Polaribacter batillariae]|uniref:Outer membrane protein beta-barrel domain-containing protein n=1 Tax=Polaribacter batillariae TaxID=2808900 RepID=A0ABX7SXP9_9FLAO|nr:hypothetical protein [Polaribacter batillariae]QTD37604.1 hypothetical protein JL193_16290 [Polaribacter batillariae]
MKKIVLIIALFVTTIATAQTKTFEKEVRKISKRIDLITKTQKDSLKMKVIEIDKKLENGEITKATADALKKEVASYHAQQIELKVGEQERLLQLLVQDKTNGKIVSASESDFLEDEVNTFKIGNKVFRFTVDEEQTNEKSRNKKRKRGYNKRTTSQFVFAMGVNNVLENNKLSSLKDSEYKFWQSHFYELGFTWKTRFTKQASQLYFKYGISFLWNNLRLQNNQQHVFDGNMTNIETRIDEELTESRLRHVQMNFPMHIEWDLSKNKKYRDGYVHDRTNRSIRLGVGGFVGFKLGTRQYLEYNDGNGVEKKQIEYDNFNMNTVNYGLSAYLGYRSTSFYVKYDLNPLFKDTEIRNISMGIRLDLN